MQYAIEVRSLSKRYGTSSRYALKDLTLQVRPGEVYGFLGPNGAGKSTAIRSMLDFIKPTSGQVIIANHDSVLESTEVKKHVGYLAGEVALYGNMTGQQLLDYLLALQPLKHKTYRAKLVADFGAQLTQPLDQLSKGNRQKIGVIQAFMHEPDVLILDEPTSGLDPLMQAVFQKTIQTAKTRGAAIFLSSHDLAEVRKMCDRIGFIRDGELIAERTIADLQSVAAHSFDITFADKPPITALKKLPGAHVRILTESVINVRLTGELTPLLRILAKHSVTALDKHEVNLEDEFLAFYEKGGRP
jgi:ABC-2 type transport system ATP-binding protein